jgi:hypothetical protein
MEAYKAMRGACAPTKGLGVQEESFLISVRLTKEKIDSLPQMVNDVRAALAAESGINLKSIPDIKKLLSELSRRPGLEYWTQTLSAIRKRCNTERSELSHKCQCALDRLLDIVDTIKGEISKSTDRGTVAGWKDLLEKLLAKEDPKEFIDKLTLLDAKISESQRNQPTGTAADEVATRIVALRDEIGDGDVITKLGKLLTLADSQQIGEHLIAIKKRQEATLVTAKVEPKTDLGKWLVKAKNTALNGIQISGNKDRDFYDDEVEAYKKIVDHLMALAEAGGGALTLTEEQLKTNTGDELAVLLKTHRGKDVKDKELYTRINKAIVNKDPEALVKAIFDEDEW